MRRKLIIYVLLFMTLQLIKVYWISDYEADYGPSRMEILISPDTKMNYNHIRFQEGYDMLMPIMNSYKEVWIEESSKNALVIGTDFNWGQLERPQMLDGAFFGEESSKEARNVAVISSTLSIDLFGSYKAVENVIHIGGQPYQIVGVYNRYERLRDYMFDHGQEHIYIPITSSQAENWQIEVMQLDGSYSEIPLAISQLQALGINSYNSIISDQTKWIQHILSLSQVPMVVLWIVLCYGGFKQIGKIVSKEEDSKIEKNSIKIVKIALVMIILGFMFFLCFHNVYMEPSSLPVENIFDINFYWESLKVEWVRHNQLLQNKVSYFEKALYQLKGLIYIINFLQIGIVIGFEKSVNTGRINDSSYRCFYQN